MEKHKHLVFFLVLLITGIVFSGSLRLEWTNWDDNLLVYENPMVREAKIKDIFTKPTEYNTFNPLVLFSFALEWKLVQDKPFLYHFNNLVLHLLCTVLIWFLFRKLGLSIWWAGFGALLFGIHPVRVESVVWIAERKDGLLGLFYIAALLAYIRYIETINIKHLILTFIFFVLSLLSKGQAVAIPFILILLDWYFKRKISLKAISEKIIFLATSLVIALLTITFFVKDVRSAADKRTIVYLFDPFEQIVLGGYAYAVYVLKSFMPYAISPLYPMPTTLQLDHWIGVVAAICIFIGSLVVWRKYKFITFGVLFFTLNIFFLLMPFLMSEKAFLFDHYTYIAFIGLFFIIAMGMQKLSEKFSSCRTGLVCFAIMLLSLFGIMTMKYIPVWQNSETLWTYVINKYPRQLAVAHFNRGNHWYENMQLDKALEDFTTAIEINPEYSSAYMNRSLIYLERHEKQKALRDYNSYMDLLYPPDERSGGINLSLSKSFNHRGSIYFRMGQYDNALVDFNAAIERDPFSHDNYLQRAFTYMALREYDKAISDFNLCHQSDPENSDIINNRGVCYLRSGNLTSALDDFNKAIQLNDANSVYYVNRALIYSKLGFIPEAKKDIQAAEQRGATVAPWLKKLL